MTNTRFFVNLYVQLEDQNFYQNNNNLPLVTLLVNKRSNIDHSTLYSISKPFELLHADIADLRFLAKSAINLEYCLLVVGLFTSKFYVYSIKNRSLLAKKLKLFYEDIKQKRTGRMRLQTKCWMMNLTSKCLTQNCWGGVGAFATE